MPPRKTGRPNNAEALARRQRILDCATAIFLENGFDNTSIDAIADAACVGKITIYRHFSSKTELFKSVVVNATQGMADSLAATLDRSLPIEEALFAYARTQGDIMVRPIAEGRPLFEMLRLIISVALRMPDVAEQFLRIFYHDMSAPLAAYLRDKRDAGLLDIADCDSLAGYFVRGNFFTDVILVDPNVLPSTERRLQIAAQCVAMFLDGCRAR